jgi:hypothetical protein
MFGEKAEVLNPTSVALKASLRSVLAVAVSAAVAFTSGCANMYTTSLDTKAVTGSVVQGSVHGGQFPVKGATIKLMVPGATGYGSNATNLLVNPVTTGPNGGFSISNDYTCPTASSQVYLTATGGDPGLGANNSAAVLVAPLGACGNLSSSTFININEVTTAATAIALGQFFTTTFGSSSTDSFGTSSTNSVGLANAFATANNLVNVATGAAVTSATLNGSGTGTGLTSTATPESAKLNTIANILAACVNSDGGASSPCQTTLFPDVTPTGGIAPTDTLQAAVYMSLNPSSNNAGGSSANLTALYGLQTATAPFVGLSVQPTDWTVGIQYSAPSASLLLSGPQNIAADAAGDIWVVNNLVTASSSLSELSPNGTPMLTSTLTSGSATLTSNNPRNLAIDTNGNPWVASSSSSAYVFEYNNSTSPGTITALNLSAGSYGIAIDGNNNVFVGKTSSSSGTLSFNEFLGGTLAAASEVQFPSETAAGLYPQYLAVDANGNLWASSGSTTTTGVSLTSVGLLSGINTSGCTSFPCTAATGLVSTYATVAPVTMSTPWAIAAAANSVWVANSAGNTLSNVSLNGTSGTDYGSASSLNAPRFPAVDGAGNVWVGNRGTSAITEFSGNGTVLSPGTGFAHSGLTSANQVTLDPSGNVWVTNATTSGANANSIFEIVGAGAPTVTPIALSLKNNKVGQKP